MSKFELFAGVAQLVEQLICNQQVVGSNPTASSSEHIVGKKICIVSQTWAGSKVVKCNRL
jgi:hypothetical protein